MFTGKVQFRLLMYGQLELVKYKVNKYDLMKYFSFEFVICSDVGQISVSQGVWTDFVDSAGPSYSKMNSRLRHIHGITTFCVESDIQQGEQISLLEDSEEDGKIKLMNFEDFPIDLSSDLFFDSQWPQFVRKDITFFSSHQRNR